MTGGNERAEAKAVTHTRELAREMIELHRQIRRLSDKTDIHSHRARAQLEQQFNELRKKRGGFKDA